MTKVDTNIVVVLLNKEQKTLPRYHNLDGKPYTFNDGKKIWLRRMGPKYHQVASEAHVESMGIEVYATIGGW